MRAMCKQMTLFNEPGRENQPPSYSNIHISYTKTFLVLVDLVGAFEASRLIRIIIEQDEIIKNIEVSR